MEPACQPEDCCKLFDPPYITWVWKDRPADDWCPKLIYFK